MPDPLLTRGASLTGYVDLARAVGLDPYRLAADTGVPAGCLTDPDLMAPAAAVGRLLQRSAARAGVEDFGLRLAETRRLSNLGAVGLVAREQPTLRRALETFVAYMWAQNQALTLRLETHGDVALLLESAAGAHPEAQRQARELTLGVLVRTIRGLVGPGWRPQAVLFAHAPPADDGTHRRLFRVAPLFDQEMNAVLLALADLDRPVAGADPEAGRHLARFAGLAGQTRSRSTAQAVRDLILALLPTGACTIARAAAHLGLSRRTLHRRLAAEGETFEGLLDRIRGELAAAYADRGDRSLTEVAGLLGYSSLSAFSRWRRGKGR